MNPNMKIRVDGRQRCGEQSDCITLQTVGSLIKKGGSWYVTYTEYGENGFTVSVTLKLAGTRAVMIRGGLSHMEFVPQKETFCDYTTEMGVLELKIRTETVSYSLCENGGNVNLLYSLFAGDNLLSQNDVRITLLPIE